jgi:hypothetical protein
MQQAIKMTKFQDPPKGATMDHVPGHKATVANHQDGQLDLSLANWPNAGSDRAGSGIACAVIVLRYLLSHFPDKDRKRFMDAQTVDRSPLLSAALLDALDPQTATELRAQLQGRDGPERLTFESLISSKSMYDSVWTNNYFRLFKKTAVFRLSAKSPWRHLPANFQHISEDQLLAWNGVKCGNLSSVLSSYADLITHLETGSQMIRFGNAPLVLRLQFCNKSPTLRFYRDLFQFTMQIASALQEPPWAGVYRCVAVVKLRATPDSHDTFRLYSLDGSVVQSDSRFWSDKWRVHDGGTTGSILSGSILTAYCQIHPLSIP